MKYWLMKSEPTAFSIDDLARRGTEPWDGVRNYQARNYLRQMRVGDQAFFYHSNCAEPAIVGLVEVVTEAYPDPSQFDPDSPYFDPKSSREAPRWSLVEVRFERKLARPITLRELKADPALAGLALLQRGHRLSVMPVTPAQWRHILALE
ncbi:EVE domain-containing protein [Aerosticca soli]|jgi:predicted RNA-binding protein with PUA-like domain|uniref:RNA-binding protein n=1 Tax=Aerosticca soli TaxID=2010829 RepID=A0A2Z6E6V7_9GAMM|nr:EVE domain-containing protein [Aerosticca soli]BBD80905.1 RNA-binding protein [Aerosticca soli]